MEKNNKINDDQLESVSGGALFYSKEIEGADHDHPWEIIDKNGDVKGRFAEDEYQLASDAARSMGYKDEVIGWEEVVRRRNKKKK